MPRSQVRSVHGRARPGEREGSKVMHRPATPAGTDARTAGPRRLTDVAGRIPSRPLVAAHPALQGHRTPLVIGASTVRGAHDEPRRIARSAYWARQCLSEWVHTTAFRAARPPMRRRRSRWRLKGNPGRGAIATANNGTDRPTRWVGLAPVALGRRRPGAGGRARLPGPVPTGRAGAGLGQGHGHHRQAAHQPGGAPGLRARLVAR